jgi:hypothetical protein
MALNWRVMKAHDILCELLVYAATFSDVSDDSESEILESDTDVLTISSRKQSQPFPLSRNRFNFIWQAWHLQ